MTVHEVKKHHDEAHAGNEIKKVTKGILANNVNIGWLQRDILLSTKWLFMKVSLQMVWTITVSSEISILINVWTWMEILGSEWGWVNTLFAAYIELFVLLFSRCHCSVVVSASDFKPKGHRFESPFPPSTYSQTRCKPNSTILKGY